MFDCICLNWCGPPLTHVRLDTATRLLADVLAKVLVVALHELPLHVEVQRLLQTRLAPHIQRHLPPERNEVCHKSRPTTCPASSRSDEGIGRLQLNKLTKHR